MAWDDLRTSPAFPALVGGLAGALGGVALIFIVSRLRAPKKTLPAAYDTNGKPMNVVYLPAPAQPRILGFTLGDLVTLGTVGFSMFRQIQEMVRQPQSASMTEFADPAALPASAVEMPHVSHRKK